MILALELSVVAAKSLLSAVFVTFEVKSLSQELFPLTVNFQPPANDPAVTISVYHKCDDIIGVPDDASSKIRVSHVTVERAEPVK